ncbi:hypothetical protein BDR06DRAFT_976813 [Suillus hirtellus]|nr:hypothetical protein BDR06DRAFT_976813 [Suillus hirtellus]
MPAASQIDSYHLLSINILQAAALPGNDLHSLMKTCSTSTLLALWNLELQVGDDSLQNTAQATARIAVTVPTVVPIPPAPVAAPIDTPITPAAAPAPNTAAPTPITAAPAPITAAPAPIAAAVNANILHEGESFHLENVSGDEGDEMVNLPAPAVGPAAGHSPLQTAMNTATTDPLATGGQSKPPKSSADIHFFFRQDPTTLSNICKACWIVVTMRQRLKDPACTLDSLGTPPSPGPLPGTSLSFPDNILPAFTLDEMHKHIVKFIIADDQPLVNETNVFHHTKICELVIDAFHEYFNALKRDLVAAQGKVSFTSDLWSDSNLCPFMALTAHWIAKADQGSMLTLRAALIGFHNVPGSHTGELLAGVIMHLTDHAAVTEKRLFLPYLMLALL